MSRVAMTTKVECVLVAWRRVAGRGPNLSPNHGSMPPGRAPLGARLSATSPEASSAPKSPWNLQARQAKLSASLSAPSERAPPQHRPILGTQLTREHRAMLHVQPRRRRQRRLSALLLGLLVRGRVRVRLTLTLTLTLALALTLTLTLTSGDISGSIWLSPRARLRRMEGTRPKPSA